MIIGVMPPQFQMFGGRPVFYAPLSEWLKPTGALGRLKADVRPLAAQKTVQAEGLKLGPKWYAATLRVTPVLRDLRGAEALFAAEVGGVGALFGMAFLIIKGMGGWRYWLTLGGRIFLALAGLCVLRLVATQAPSSVDMYSTSLFVFWVFLLLCCAVGFLLVFDHRGRCLVCFRRLRRPVSLGLWSSQILDQPATEYLCPAGHGTLYIAETGNAPDHWTKLDETWQHLFARESQE